jgi:hypothetical protein
MLPEDLLVLEGEMWGAEAAFETAKTTFDALMVEKAQQDAVDFEKQQRDARIAADATAAAAKEALDAALKTAQDAKTAA